MGVIANRRRRRRWVRRRALQHVPMTRDELERLGERERRIQRRMLRVSAVLSFVLLVLGVVGLVKHCGALL